MTVIIFLSLHLFTAMDLPSGTDSLFNRANACYRSHRYSEAQLYYHAILENGTRSAAVYYNLANTHYQMQRLGPAIYYYHKALQLSPGDEDILHNLAQTELHIQKSIYAPPEIAFLNSIKARFYNIHVEWFSSSALLFWLILGLVLIFYWLNKIDRRKFLLYLSIILFLFCSANICWFLRLSKEKQSVEGIILTTDVSAKENPEPGSSPVFALYEGWRVAIINEEKNWVQIRLPDGQEGWIPVECIGIL
jgi:tetratricopeptide (TPR) repeat protein